MRRFLVCSNLVKYRVFKILLRKEISPPVPTVAQILVSEFQSEGIYSLSKRARFWPLDIL